MRRLVILIFGLGIVLTAAALAQPEGFTLHARFLGIGGNLATVVGPGPTAGTERVYATHIYVGDTLDLVAVDPLTGETDVFSSPVPTEIGAWALAVGPEGRVYVGTLPNAHILRLDWSQRALVDMGQPSPTEQYVWQLCLGPDGKLYGCTYPNAKLIRFDPLAGTGEDLGRMDPKELYARHLAADDQGFVYVGIGFTSRHLVAYEIGTGMHRDILPAELAGPGCCSVYRGDDGKVYATAGDARLRLEGWTATVIAADQVRPAPPLRLGDGCLVSYDGTTVTVRDAATGEAKTNPVAYAGKPIDLFRIGLGPDDRLYGSTALPLYFFRADPDGDAWELLGRPGGGEIYSFLAYDDRLICAAYGGSAPIMIYRPAMPYAPAPTREGNPWLVHYPGEDSGWRPMAMIAGPDGKVYIGAVAGYGKLGGPLCCLDPETGAVEQYPHVVQDQSVVALAALPDGLIVGGTTISGGGGSFPTQAEAKIFLWDTQQKKKIFETVPVAGQSTIQALAVGRDRLVYGFAGPVMFVFDPVARQVIGQGRHGLGSVIYNALGPGPDGELYGLATGGIFTVDTAARQARIMAAYPGGITGGFAIRGRRIYFTSGPEIVSYALP
ncbi:MAG: hypothetical protein N2512_12895 [Armatimonadetes bacterium]|nr:hypothetical protein [Armatimonadota bacterium]